MTIIPWCDPHPCHTLALDCREESERSSENDNTGKLAGSKFKERSNDNSDSQAQQEQDSIHSAASANDEEEELDEDTPLTITIPQKRANRTAVSKHQKVSPCIYIPVELITEYWTLYLEKPNNSVCDDSQDCNAEPPAFDITYNLAFFSTAKLQQPIKHCKPIANYLVLKSDMPWEDFFVQLKKKVHNALYPAQPIVNDDTFGMKFLIPRHVTIPLDLTSAADYTHLLANISKIKINSSAKVIIERHAPNLVCIQFWLLLLMLKISTGTWEEKFTKPCWGGCTPSPSWCQSQENRKNQGIVHQLAIGLNVNGLQAPQEVDISPANLSLNDKIHALRNQWECNVINCCSEHCFVLLEGPHFTLSHTHLKKWGAAIVCYLIVVVVNWLWIYVT